MQAVIGRLRNWLSGPTTTVVLPLVAAGALLLTGCGEETGTCVQVYEFEGTVEKDNYTRSECEDECAIIGRTLQCFFQPDVMAPTGPVAARRGG